MMTAAITREERGVVAVVSSFVFGRITRLDNLLQPCPLFVKFHSKENMRVHFESLGLSCVLHVVPKNMFVVLTYDANVV